MNLHMLDQQASFLVRGAKRRAEETRCLEHTIALPIP